MTDKDEAGIILQMADVFRAAGNQVVKTDNLMAFCQQTVAEVGPEESGASGDQASRTRWWLFSHVSFTTLEGRSPL